MHNIDHFKSLISTELESLVIEINNLKTRVTELELKTQPQIIHNQDNIEYIGRWVAGGKLHVEEHSTVTCNTNVIS